ncbi:AAA family ATPase [[Mycoplasma] collis]|uniref:AAA family ATPase n=1 Tax=[Mycoplasma] collis TaxID=2127 RepID=UPI000691EC12|nr:AAA family ATPase [[Mycoplasma] collis]
MSFYNSTKKLIDKIFYKNITIVSGNIDDLIYLRYLNDSRLKNVEFPSQYFINLKQFIGLVLKEFDFKKIETFIPGKGVIDLTKDLLDQNSSKDIIRENSDVIREDDDEFEDEDGENNLSIPIEQYINEIINYINTLKSEDIKTDKQVAIILNLSDLLLKETNPTFIANLISTFIEISDYKANDYIKNNYKLILLCKNSDALNNLIFENNVEIAYHTISFPNREERKAFFEVNLSKFNDHFEEKMVKEKKEFDEAIMLTNDFSFRGILQLIKVLNKKNSFKNFKELYRNILFDKKESEWEKIDQNKIKFFKEEIKKRVKGQDFAINETEKTLIRSFVGLSDSSSFENKKKPKGILFFTGPTGTGKTELSKALAEFIFGDQNSLIRFDMSEYNHEHSDQKLIGSPPGYVGYESGGQLTNAIKQKPFSILLFDEIEKAHGKILDKFLQILEDGRLTSSKGELIDFSETFIIFTSNIGVKETLYLAKDKNVDENTIRNKFKSEINKYFKETLGRPEILNRIGDKNIIPFNFIMKDEIIKEIIFNQLGKMNKLLKKEKNIVLSQSSENDLITLFTQVRKGFNHEFGARGLIAEFEKIFIDVLVYFIFNNIEKIKDNQKENLITKLQFSFDENDELIFKII